MSYHGGFPTIKRTGHPKFIATVEVTFLFDRTLLAVVKEGRVVSSRLDGLSVDPLYQLQPHGTSRVNFELASPDLYYTFV